MRTRTKKEAGPKPQLRRKAPVRPKPPRCTFGHLIDYPGAVCPDCTERAERLEVPKLPDTFTMRTGDGSPGQTFSVRGLRRRR